MKHPRKMFGLVAALVAVAITAWLVVPLAISTAAPRSASSTTATKAHRFTNVPVTGTFGSGGTFKGVLDITRFATSNGQVVAVGKLSGTATRASGVIARSVINQAVQIPLQQATGTCTILHLVLGPIHLNLLGLHIDTNRIVIDITAESGPGNLLGNLLCAIAHLLDNPPVSNAVITNLLTVVVKVVGSLRLLT
jgi:hypothetical protein